MIDGPVWLFAQYFNGERSESHIGVIVMVQNTFSNWDCVPVSNQVTISTDSSEEVLSVLS